MGYYENDSGHFNDQNRFNQIVVTMFSIIIIFCRLILGIYKYGIILKLYNYSIKSVLFMSYSFLQASTSKQIKLVESVLSKSIFHVHDF